MSLARGVIRVGASNTCGSIFDHLTPPQHMPVRFGSAHVYSFYCPIKNEVISAPRVSETRAGMPMALNLHRFCVQVNRMY
jgi:hypothetical protein